MVKLLECFIFKLLKPIDRNNCSNFSIASGCPATVPFMPSFAIIIEPRILFVIIKMFSNISGAHFNPAVSFVFYLRKELELKEFYRFALIQIVSGLAAIFAMHYIFEMELLQVSANVRGEIPLLISEVIATAGLMMTILFIRKNDENSVAIGVALFITAGYWFTSSTSFANPAVTIARMFTDTFTGIAPASFAYFLSGQIIGSILGHGIFKLFDK